MERFSAQPNGDLITLSVEWAELSEADQRRIRAACAQDDAEAWFNALPLEAVLELFSST
jgi:hypothetical protein